MNRKTRESPAVVDGPVRPAAISGIQALHGLHQRSARPFWLDVWDQVLGRPGAWVGMIWLGVVGALALLSPVLANGAPIWVWFDPSVTDPRLTGTRSPMLASLSSLDVLLLLAGAGGLLYLLLPAHGESRWPRFGTLVVLTAVAAGATQLIGAVKGHFSQAFLPDWQMAVKDHAAFRVLAVSLPPVLIGGLAMVVPFTRRVSTRAVVLAAVAAATAGVGAWKWAPDVPRYRDIQGLADAGLARAAYTLVPWSPSQGSTELRRLPPGETIYSPIRLQAERLFKGELIAERGTGLSEAELLGAVRALEVTPERLEAYLRVVGRSGIPERSAEVVARLTREAAEAGRIATMADSFAVLEDPSLRYAHGRFRFQSGTDNRGQDVLSQMLHACRIAITIGVVSTSIAMMIGVTFGALMGYFGGWVDMVGMRIVEIFMAIPVLFLLIVASAVLPRSVFVMMIIIGCVRWTNAARFTRAEFLKLRGQDFVQAAQAAGLPLRSILFKHMLPNGVTPVLVESSFTVAAAILIESALSYLGLSPEDTPSWGRLLSLARDPGGEFSPWLAVMPGFAIFMTVLSYNLIGEALRDAIDPKLKKAAH